MHSLEVIKARNAQAEVHAKAAAVNGHLGLDNPVQSHSAGPLYPFVIVTVQQPIGALDDEIFFCQHFRVVGPGIDNELPQWPVFNHFEAAYHTAKRLRVLLDNADAWCGAIERACTSASVGGAHIPGVLGALRQWHEAVGVPKLWVKQTPSQRVRSVIFAWTARCAFGGYLDRSDLGLLRRVLG